MPKFVDAVVDSQSEYVDVCLDSSQDLVPLGEEAMPIKRAMFTSHLIIELNIN